MINRKFINFKTYNGFLAKKNEIPNDAIVFIQDKLCIWAQGKEYICDGPGTTAIVDNTLTFTNGNNKAVFTVTQEGGTLEFKDSEGNKSSATYILRDEFDSKANQADLDILNEWKTAFERRITNIVASQVDRSELADVAFSGQYQDLKSKPDIPVVDSTLSSSSTNPVWNKTITLALEGKANTSDLDNYVTSHNLTKAISSKQDVLKAGRGISIDGVIISSTLDTEVYVMVNELGNPADADPNKIYILEKKVGDEYKYQQYRSKDNTWVLIGEISPNVDLTGYLTKTSADTYYQPIGDYLTDIDLSPYALATDLVQLNENLGGYALLSYVNNTFQEKGEYAYKDYVDNTFVKRSEVYNPKQDNWGTDSTSGGGSEPIIINQGSNITVDSALSLTSANPVQNAVITAELNKKVAKSQLLDYATIAQLDAKADKTQLNKYITNTDLIIALESKQDNLTAGNGISIVNNVISTDLDIDTSVYVFVDKLPLTNINNDKIYIVGEEDDGEIVYTQWKHQDGDWIPIGQLQAEIDLSNYITRSDAAATFAPKLNYVTDNVLELFRQNLEDLFQKKGNYITLEYADNTYQPKNNYLTSVDLVPYAKITDLDAFLTAQDLQLAMSALATKEDIADFATRAELQSLSDFIAQTYLKLLAIYTIDAGVPSQDPSGGNDDGGSTGSDPEDPTNINPDTPNQPQTIINNTTVVYDIEVDSALSATSYNPVQNKIVTRALQTKADVSSLNDYAKISDLNSKADKSQLSDYVTSTQLTTALNTKQDPISAGTGIAISGNVISCTVDTTLYIVVDELPAANTADPNKIYILETYNQNGTFRYQQYRLRKGTWASFDAAMPTIDLSGYLTKLDAQSTYQIAGPYLTAVDLEDYAKLSDLNSINVDLSAYATKEYVDGHFMTAGGDYALTSYVDENFVKKSDVYNPKQGTWGTSSTDGVEVGGGTTTIVYNYGTDITVDKNLSTSSSNPVQNSTITLALMEKADLADLEQYALASSLNSKLDASVIQDYVTTIDLESALDDKQDCLTAGDGISIIDNVISSTIDTNMWVIVDELPSTNINSNKIYLVETEDNGETIYIEYRYRDGEWVEIGQKTPEVDLSDYQRKGNYIEVEVADNRYLTEQKIAGRYQEAGDYVESDYADEHYQEKGNYIKKDVFDAFRASLANTFQASGNYVTPAQITAALTTLQNIIDQKYVLKTDVPMGNDYSISDPVEIQIDTQGSSEQGGGSVGVSNMVTLTVEQYQTLVDNNLVKENTYYFTYEEEEATTWGFGDQFPIILTDGSTPDSIGTFPINLT